MWIRSLKCGKDAKDAKMVDQKDVITREATSDRITLGVTAVLTLSAISLDSRSDLPKVIRTIIVRNYDGCHRNDCRLYIYIISLARCTMLQLWIGSLFAVLDIALPPY